MDRSDAFGVRGCAPADAFWMMTETDCSKHKQQDCDAYE